MTDDTTPTSGSSSDAPEPDGPADSLSPAGSSSAEPGQPRRKRFVRRHWILVSLGVVLMIIIGSAGGYLYWVNKQLSNIPKFTSPTIIQNRTTSRGKSPETGRALNILLLGADNGQGTETVAQDLKDGKWTPFVHRSDTIMVVHIPADRKNVQLVSIPRDTWVHIHGYPYDNQHGKINAAFAYGGPDLAVKTVQHLTHIPIDHVAIIDWAGFKDLTTAIGGVRVYIPQTFYDDSQRITWTKGWHTFKGQEALAYVRTRHGLSNGDFGRIQRQQNFLRATMGQLLSQSHNIFAMTKVINVITKYLTIDSTWSAGDIENLALSLRNIKQPDVTFVTAPLGSYGMVAGQSIVRLAPAKSKLLFRDIKTDDVASYLKKYPQAKLSGDKSVK